MLKLAYENAGSVTLIDYSDSSLEEGETPAELLVRIAGLPNLIPVGATHIQQVELSDVYLEFQSVFAMVQDAGDSDGDGDEEDYVVSVPMPEARLYYMDQIRIYRNGALNELDKTELIAMSTEDATALAAVRAQKQTLRDLPENTDLSSYTTPETLSAFWPAELGAKPY